MAHHPGTRSSASRPQGILYVCATPIGNLEDITLRVLRALKEADVIAAEDTRVTRKLLAHYDIVTPLTSYREHNEVTKGRELIGAIRGGKTVALVSDAGMPGISDPGHRLITSCIEQNVPFEVLPGPSSLMMAVVASGLPTDSFVFQGFLPRKKGERDVLLRDLLAQKRTAVVFESPRRLKKTLEEVAQIDPSRDVVVARELTKRFEELLRGTAEQLCAQLRDVGIKGEIVLLFGPAHERRIERTAEELKDAVAGLMKTGTPKKQAISEVSKTLGVSKRLVYEAAINIR